MRKRIFGVLIFLVCVYFSTTVSYGSNKQSCPPCPPCPPQVGEPTVDSIPPTTGEPTPGSVPSGGDDSEGGCLRDEDCDIGEVCLNQNCILQPSNPCEPNPCTHDPKLPKCCADPSGAGGTCCELTDPCTTDRYGHVVCKPCGDGYIGQSEECDPALFEDVRRGCPEGKNCNNKCLCE